MAKRKKKDRGRPEPEGELLSAVVVRSTGSWYRARIADGSLLECRLRGKFRIKGIKTTNPVAVGDHIKISVEDNVGFIREIEDRRNYVLRKSVNLARRAHILCANIDQAIIVFTVADPVTTLGYVDRLLVTCEAYHIPAVVLFNKVDVLSEEDLNKLEDFKQIYTGIGYPIHVISATDPQYQDEVRTLLGDKVSFLVGRSGAGKSTVVNLAEPELKLKVGDISEWSGRGRHTTTFAEMHDLSFGGHIIDSPGFKEMVIFDFEKGELCHYFPEMRPYLDGCKFSNCIHVREPGCAVKEAVESGGLPMSRYHTYLSMLEEIKGSGW